MGADSISPLRGSYLLRHLADRTCAVTTSCVGEIVHMAKPSRLPGAPAFLPGIRHVDRQLAAAISERRLSVTAEHERELDATPVILKGLPHEIALAIEVASRIVKIGGDKMIRSAEGCCLNDCTSAVTFSVGIACHDRLRYFVCGGSRFNGRIG
jgi:chemotaxis signal transduction protein